MEEFFRHQEEKDRRLEGMLHRMSKEIDDLKAAVAAEDTVIASAVTLLKGLADQIAALKPDAQAITDLAADVRAQTVALAGAVQSGTPTEQPTTP